MQPANDLINSYMPSTVDHQAMLRVSFGVHFLLTTVVLLGSWVPRCYEFYNGFLLVGLLWAINCNATESELPLLKCLFINLMSFLMDIFCMTRFHGYGFDGLALAAAIGNFLFRFVSTYGVHRVRTERMRLRYDNWDNNSEVSGRPGSHSDASSIIGAGGPPTYDFPRSTIDADRSDAYGGDTKPIAP